MGNVFPQVIPPSAHKLHCGFEYNAVFNKLMDCHQIFKRMNALNQLAEDMPIKDFQVKLKRWDYEMTDCIQGHPCKQLRTNVDSLLNEAES